MSYQVLARKWRPKAFNEVVGQQHILKVLENSLSLGRVHHAYLFSGTRGVGKTSIARLLAKGLNCESGITASPCGECENCRDIEQGRFVDLLEIDAASRTKVEDTREILDNIQYLPTKGRFKVYLIDEVHMLSRSSFNALLKTLEEPPEHVKFLLATTDPQKLPITILSRCLHLHLNALDSELIMQQLIKILQSENIPTEERAAQLLAKSANGSMRDGLSLTDQAIALGNGKIDISTVSSMLGTLDKCIPFNLVEALFKADGNALMQHIEHAGKQGVDWDSLMTETISLLHQISFLQVVPTAIGDYSDYEERIRHLAQFVAPNDIQLFYQILLNGRKELVYAPNKRTGVEMSFLRALAFIPKSLQDDAPVTQAQPQPRPQPQSPAQVLAQVQAQTQVQAQSQPQTISVPTPIKEDEEPVPQATKPVNSEPVVAKVEQPAFNAQKPEPKPEPEQKAEPVPVQAPKPEQSEAQTAMLDDVSDVTKSILLARQQLIEQENAIKKQVKVEEIQPTPLKKIVEAKTTANNDLAIQEKSEPTADEAQTAETYQWQFSEHFTQPSDDPMSAKSLKMSFEHEKTPQLTQKLIEEAVQQDKWSAEIEQLTLPPLVKQIAINSYLQELDDNKICLHLRSPLSHLLRNESHCKKLIEILSAHRQQPLTIEIIVDDEKKQLTPLEVREQIYQQKLAQAKKSINDDAKVAMLCQFFEAKIDDETIRPV
ncbi:DNA polymerase III subunit gamma/tau [Orbaceae bacterium ac157xtp]